MMAVPPVNTAHLTFTREAAFKDMPPNLHRVPCRITIESITRCK